MREESPRKIHNGTEISEVSHPLFAWQKDGLPFDIYQVTKPQALLRTGFSETLLGKNFGEVARVDETDRQLISGAN